MNRLHAASLLLLFLAVGIAIPGAAQDVTRDHVPAGVCLELLFDVERSAAVRSRGALQRTFSDLLCSAKRNLQIAFVLDGTDSMGADIRSVLKALRGMSQDLSYQLDEGTKIGFGVVVYRDSGSKKISFPLEHRFSSDLEELENALDTVETMTGEPYFHELVDVGLREAIVELDWRPQDDTTRWIILIGDAPPYPEGYSDTDRDAGRQYTNEELISLAKERDITINAILCSSGFSGQDYEENSRVQRSYEASLPETESFMNLMADQTRGFMLNLSDQELRQKIASAAQQDRTEYQQIAQITHEDVEQSRGQLTGSEASFAAANRVRIAVLPHLPRDKMSFDSAIEEVQVSTGLRQKLRLLPGVEVANSKDVEGRIEKLGKEEYPQNRWLQKLAAALRVDYIIWGELSRTSEQIQLVSVAYKRIDGERVADAKEIAKVGQATREGNELGQAAMIASVADRLMYNMSATLDQMGVDPQAVKFFTRLESDIDLAGQFQAPVSENHRAQRELLAGLESLEQALAYEKGSPEAFPLLEEAVHRFNAAVLLEPENPLTLSLLASAYFNQADFEVDEENIRKFHESLKKAHRYVENSPHEIVSREVKADYALLIENDVSRAIDLYAEIIRDATDSPANSVLRAHWMLAGIFAGDWNVSDAYIAPEKAREHVIQILAHWETSAEARFLRRSLRWDEQEGTQQKHLPRQYGKFALSR